MSIKQHLAIKGLIIVLFYEHFSHIMLRDYSLNCGAFVNSDSGISAK